MTLSIKKTGSVIASIVLCSVLSGNTKGTMTVLLHMTEAQKHFFINETAPAFEKTHDVNIRVIAAQNLDDLDDLLKKHSSMVSLVKLPFVSSWSMVQQNEIMSLQRFLPAKVLSQYQDEYILTWLGAKNGRNYFMPRKYETRICVYRKSKVADAIETFDEYRDTIDALLAQVNGVGLPNGYALEKDANKWDFFDIFVMGVIWSRTGYNGEQKARIAHRGKKYSGTANRLIDRVYQCGGDSLDLMHMHGYAVTDAFLWEALYAWAGVFTPRMWKENWTGKDIWKAFGEQEVFLSFVTQIDCFYLFGTGKDGLEGYVEDTDDLGLALMPSGCSVHLDHEGEMLRRGTSAVSTGGWWWAIPRRCPHPELAFRLFAHITGRQNQIEECTRFGMIPVRRDLVKDNAILEGQGWMPRVFRLSYAQIQHNDDNVIISHPQFCNIADAYLDAWDAFVVLGNWSDDGTTPNRDYIAKMLRKEYATRISEMLR